MADIKVKVEQQNLKASVTQSKNKLVGLKNQQSDVSVVDQTQLEVEVKGNIPLIKAPVLGIQGPAGVPGDEVNKTIEIAGESITKYKVVYLNTDGLIYVASTTVEDHANRIIGMAVDNASINDPIFVQHSGTVDNPSWAWTPGNSLFVDEFGDLKESDPDLPTDLYVSFFADATSPTSIEIHIREPLFFVPIA